MAASRDDFRSGMKIFAQLPRHEKNWVTAALIEEFTLQDHAALDDFVASMQAARAAIRGGVSVFLSYSSRDKRFVRALATYLESRGISVWLDEADLLGGESLLQRLASAVTAATLLVVVLSYPFDELRR